MDTKEMTAKEMRKLLKSLGITGISRTKKSELEKLLEKLLNGVSKIPVETVTVTCGVEEDTFDLAGLSVDSSLKIIKSMIKLPKTTTVLVNGIQLEKDYILQPNDVIEIVKNSYVKG